MPEIVGQHGVWQQDCDHAVQEVISCAGMSWGQAETAKDRTARISTIYIQLHLFSTMMDRLENINVMKHYLNKHKGPGNQPNVDLIWKTMSSSSN